MANDRNLDGGRVSRRDLGRLGLVGAGMAAGLAVPAVRQSIAQDEDAPTGPAKWTEPSVVMSVDGLLDIDLTASPIQEAGVGLMAYNGSIPGPTLRIRSGDTLRIKLTNNLGGHMTNLHTHGLHVSPKGNSDNIFVMLDQGEHFQYEYHVPENHPGGTLWYHPHHHGDATLQVNSGLAGALIIENELEEMPEITALPERIFLFGVNQGGSQPGLTINGVLNPEVPMRPGQSQRWRFFNVTANSVVDLSLAGHTFDFIGFDGNPLPKVVNLDHYQLGPGERAEAIVTAGEAGTYTLSSLAWGTGGQAQDEMVLATVTVAGSPMESAKLPEKLVEFEDLRKAEIAETRIMNFQEGANHLPFSINDAPFDLSVVNVTAKLGTVEEWILRNTSNEWHPFHIHVNDFQVLTVNGKAIGMPNREDTIMLPPHGQVVIRIPFYDFDGKFVFHCHILSHEDFGMMQVIEVVP